jgi:glutaredoxin 3
MPEVLVYVTRFCPYCVRARALLDRKGVAYRVVDVGTDPRFWAEMERRSRRTTVPQIFIGPHHVGGYDDLAALNADGRLDEFLGLRVEGGGLR